jgi:hypothetical protein
MAVFQKGGQHAEFLCGLGINVMCCDLKANLPVALPVSVEGFANPFRHQREARER